VSSVKETQINKNTKDLYDVLVVGGGITGAGLLRDFTLHGKKTLLVEKGDFSCQTSSKSSKMLHGGIRYLEQLDFSLVWEALHEKNYWLNLAPHLCYESSFYMPVYKTSKFNKYFLKAGLMTYDLLSSYKNSPHKLISKKQTLEILPQLKADGLTSTGIYYDAIVDDTRLVIENILDALKYKNATAKNYTEVVQVLKDCGHYIVTLKDNLTEQLYNVTTKDIVFALGPMTDIVLNKLLPHWENKLVPSRGIHLWFSKEHFPLSKPVVLQTKDNRVLFIIPQKDHVFVGTTEKIIFSEIENPKPHSDEIKYLLQSLNRYFNTTNLSEKNIVSSMCGIRPLYKEGNGDLNSSANVSRHHKVLKPAQNMYVIVGGKLTTFRTMAQSVVSQVINSNNEVYNSSLTLSPLKFQGVSPFDLGEIDKNLINHIREKELVSNDEDLLLRRLCLVENSELYKKVASKL
jgi:glycerol-3-phosphate dehydrogenase